jgi:hypothetical protein
MNEDPVEFRNLLSYLYLENDPRGPTSILCGALTKATFMDASRPISLHIPSPVFSAP